MKWSLPLVELSRPAARCASPLSAALTLVAVVLPCIAGCSALPVMQPAPIQVAIQEGTSRPWEYSDAEKLRLSQLPITPDFDTPAAAIASMKEVASSKMARTESTNAGPAIAGAGQKNIAPSDAPSSVQIPMLRIDAPKPFAWTPIGKTSGDRSFQTVTVGDEGYRSLVIGSVAGNDPLALELVEQLARHLHNGNTILGGFRSTVVRTLNPDGESLHNVLNAKGQYINHGFPKDNGIADGNQPVEVTFLLHQIETLQPQCVIHVRTIEGTTGLIAASSGCLATANESGEWLGFRVINLPGKAVSGSLERHLAGSGRCEVMTFAIPATAKKGELWDRYGDALQNLLMGEDAEARELARQQTQHSSAISRDAADR